MLYTGYWIFSQNVVVAESTKEVMCIILLKKKRKSLETSFSIITADQVNRVSSVACLKDGLEAISHPEYIVCIIIGLPHDVLTSIVYI